MKRYSQSTGLLKDEMRQWETYVGVIDPAHPIQKKGSLEKEQQMSSTEKLPQIQTPGQLQRSELYARDLESLNKSNLVKSIDQYGKSSDVTDIIGKNQIVYPRTMDEAMVVDPEKQLSTQLLGLRKTYDDMREKSNQKDKQIVQMRNELDIIQNQIGNFTDTEFFVLKQIEDLTVVTESKKLKLQEAQFEQQTFLHMLERMKHDLLIYQKQVNQTEVVLASSKQFLHSIEEVQQKVSQKNQKTKMAFHEVLTAIEEEQDSRTHNLDKLRKDIEQKRDVEEQRETQMRRQEQIAQSAQNELRDSNLQKWKQLYHVNFVLSVFLKSQMQREMDQYQNVERAFQQIKSSTGVSDAGEIVYKFLNRENTYSHLLKSISDYEKRIDELKQQREILNDKLNLNQASTNNSQKTDAQLKLEIDEQTQLFLEVAEKAQNVELVEKRVWEWSLKNWRKIQKIYGDDKPFDQYVKDYPKTQDIPKVFKLIIKFVNENIRNLNQKELEQIIDENYAKKQFDDDYYKKNVRVTLDNKSSIINFSRTMSNESQIVSDRDEMDRSQNVFDQFDDNEDAEEIKQMEKEEATFIKEEQKQVKQTK